MTDFIPPVSEMDTTPVGPPWFSILALVTATLFLFSSTSSRGENTPGWQSPVSVGGINHIQPEGGVK